MRFTIARHAETVHNSGRRMQGNLGHTPLTRTGITQADAMGAALAEALGQNPALDFWSSSAGRTVQTAAIIAEYLGMNYFDIRTDERLFEIDVGDWQGRTYEEIVAEVGPILSAENWVFTVQAPNGEWFPDIEARLKSWLGGLAPDRDVLVITHGIASRVLRGLLAGGTPYEGVLLADSLPQGSIVQIEDGRETILRRGEEFPASAAGSRA